ncbi:MAG: outer membrane beta-barrel protein, partial [Ginsengibacter sp.]
AKIVYTEPLAKNYSLELGYQLAYNFGTNNQLTYNYSPVSNKYEALVDSLSNQFKQNILQNIPSAKINFANKKVKINIGSGFGFTNFDLKDLTYNKDYTRNYVNFYPTANFTYTYKPNHTLRINYNGNTTQPTINQLQPLRNNNDYFNQYIGNPNLKPSFTNTFYVSHQTYNFLKDIFAYQGLNVSFISNSISNNRVINVDSGKTVTQPVNTNGNISLNAYGGMGFKIKKIDTRFYFSPQLNYSRYADIINGLQSFSKTIAPGINVSLQKQKEKKYDFSISNQFNYNSNTTSQNDTKIHYNSNTLSLNATIYYKKVWSLLSDLQLYSRQKTSQFDKNLNSNQWGARLQRTFKNNEFTAYVSVHDILNDNIGVDRSFYSNTYTQVTNDRLKRYFLVGFEWDFKNKAAKTK